MKALKHARAIILLPGMATLVIPGTIVWGTSSVHVGWSLPFPFNLGPLLLGLLLLGFGLGLGLKTVLLLATLGRGTLAPWNPTRKLVTQGVYRYVRNPMISSVFFILLGEAILLGSLPLLLWFIIFVGLNLVYIPRFEEPGLKRRFGPKYLRYQQHVPRWLPRLRPWAGPSTAEATGEAPVDSEQTG